MRASFGVLAQLVAVAVPVAAVQLATEGRQPSLVGGRKVEAHGSEEQHVAQIADGSQSLTNVLEHNLKSNMLEHNLKSFHQRFLAFHGQAAKQALATEKVEDREAAKQALAIKKVKDHHLRMEELIKYKTAVDQLIHEEKEETQKDKSAAGIPSEPVELRVVNLASDGFTVRADGQQKLLQIPRALSDNKELKLRVDAEFEHLGSQHCGAAHIKSLSFFGNWTGKMGVVELKPGSDEANTPMLIDTQPKFQGTSTLLKFGGIIFLVDKKYDGRSGRPKSYLDVLVKNLTKQHHYDVGGILGLDDHTQAELPGAGCESAQGPSPGASTIMIETGSSADAASAGSRAMVLD